ncbi:Ca(2+)-dependent cysteine protease, partial [Boothiomyces sp. JEL0838]
NQRIHMIFVPTILATAQVWLSATPTVATWALSKQLPINSAFILTAIYNLYYLSLHKQIGALMTPILWGMLFGANKFLNHFGTQKAMSILLLGHSKSVTIFADLDGHQVYEKRAPAFIKDPIQALVLAPLFVFCEFLFELGFYPKTKKELTDKIGVKALFNKGVIPEKQVDPSKTVSVLDQKVLKETIPTFGPRPPIKRALVIGINYRGQKYELNGCINDTNLIYNYLTLIGYQDIMVMNEDKPKATDSYPYRKYIIKAFSWLVADAREGDSFFFHFSGHAALKPKKDGTNENALFPIDHFRRGMISESEIYDLMVKPLPKGCKLMSIFDCCHSGSMLGLAYNYSLDGSLKPIMKSNHTGKLERFFFKKPTVQVDKDKITNAQIIMVSGCQDNQQSAEYVIGSNGESYGAMTFHMVQILREHNDTITCIELLKCLRERLKARYKQRPQLSTGYEMEVATTVFSIV